MKINLLSIGDAPDRELTSILRTTAREVMKTNNPFWLLIGGYDDDPRHLWAIPEMLTFAIKLVKIGFLSPLVLMPDIENPTSNRGWTAYELWLCSRGELTSSINVQRMLQDLDGDFIREVLEANQRCENLVSDSIN